ncbi:hypothetical protein ACHAXS_001674 [Conticribra weissflogii]
MNTVSLSSKIISPGGTLNLAPLSSTQRVDKHYVHQELSTLQEGQCQHHNLGAVWEDSGTAFIYHGFSVFNDLGAGICHCNFFALVQDFVWMKLRGKKSRKMVMVMVMVVVMVMMVGVDGGVSNCGWRMYRYVAYISDDRGT